MAGLTVVRSAERLREVLADGRGRVGLVPTMGALHRGHLALVGRARSEAERVVVSIFVNPTQFAPGEDLAAYPRTEDSDLGLLADAGADIAFVPSPAAMYPEGFATTITPAGAALAGLEDRVRPGHFAGVATVVAKLLLQSRADLAVFGEKDYQQLRVVDQTVRDLDIPARIVGHDTVREPDGLALSSRNRYLSAADRALAPELFTALTIAAAAIRGGAEVERALAEARWRLEAGGFVPDYIELRNADSLAPAEPGTGVPLRLLAAARLGHTRLIDNVAV